jgi:hypothetical protein
MVPAEALTRSNVSDPGLDDAAEWCYCLGCDVVCTRSSTVSQVMAMDVLYTDLTLTLTTQTDIRASPTGVQGGRADATTSLLDIVTLAR